jgi:transketolase
VREHFVRTLWSLAAKDQRIILITGDLGFGVLDKFSTDYPRQYLNVGVAEQNMTGVATGLALTGRIVFTYSIGNFPTLRCLEQIRNDACYHDANVKIVAVGGGFSYGSLGISHHATEDLSIMRSLPHITIFSPGDHWEAEQATEALVTTPGTCYLRLDKSAARPTTRPGEIFLPGKARIVREGSALTLFATGGILGVALDAADMLASEGVDCRIVSVHTIKPFDADAVLAACRDTGGIITVEEHTLDGGLGSLVAETCLDAGVMPRAFHRIGLRAGFSSIVGSQDFLRQSYGMDANAIVSAIRSVLSKVGASIGGNGNAISRVNRERAKPS